MWKARIDKSNARLFYKPGKEKLVAGAVFRWQLNALEEEEAEYFVATKHSVMSLTHTTESTDKPMNSFKNQIVLEEARLSSKSTFILFGYKK